MMLGTRDAFEYSECGDCGAVQRVRPDIDLTKYYPSAYYAFAPDVSSPIFKAARSLRNWVALSNASPLRRVAQLVYPHPASDWLRLPRPSATSRILDVGCGKGVLLKQLADAGFSRLTGVDPYLPDRVEVPSSVRMIRSDLGALQGEFDLIMFHHSLEHIVDQQSTLAATARLLSPGGWCLIRVPISSSWAWEHYRESWYQLDAPRHAVLHSRRSLEELGRGAGLALQRVDFDSSEWQILWSERYRQNIAMSDSVKPFSRSERRAARQAAARLNAAETGDQLVMYFRKPGS
jgi:SAM-dependent methyltransferase